ncbi:hypothetical protein ACFV7R_29865 [Streptomyces sp. NPDC059866]|uniref:hypothetical protein n=1 Tax=Streptomyces sp. NPDC059866 TaxID=3346978 RepID=UPI00364E1D80
MTAASDEHVRLLARTYQPVLLFSSGERVFPALVESYLSHVSAAPWVPLPGQTAVRDLGVVPEVPGGPHRRGTAIMDGRPPGVLRGGRSASGAPLGRRGADADSIGNSAYRGPKASPDLFLTFGGWRDAACTEGDAEYLVAAFSELAAAMDPGQRWEEFESLPNRPVLWVEQPTTPTVYAEAAWCGDYGRADDRVERADAALRDFAQGPDRDSLSRVLALTYHLFFPLQDDPRGAAGRPGTGNPGDRLREGQWVAATVFFEGTPAASGDPSEFDVVEPPLAVSLSRDRTSATTPDSCRPWDQVVRDGSGPRLYVSRGQHRLLFAAPDDPAGTGQPPVGGGAAAVTRLDTEDPGQGNFPGSEQLLVMGLLLNMPLALLGWLISLFSEVLRGEPLNGPNGPPADVSTPAGDGAGPIASPSGAEGPGAVLKDGRRIDDPATSLLRVVNALPRDPQRTSWPDDDAPGAPPPDVEYPYWWDFSGLWGVRVAPNATAWTSGMQRVDRFGRSLGYWNTVGLARAWAQDLVRRPGS